MRRVATLIVALALGLALCAPAAAQVGPLPPPDAPPQAPPPAPASTEDEGLSTFEELLIFGAAAALIAGIAWVIVRDARRAAPVQERSQKDARKPSAREREREQRQRRDKAKAARQQRKRNRRR